MTYVEQQLVSPFHMQAKKLLFWMIVTTAIIPGAGYFLLFLFFLYTSFPLLKQMFMWMAIFMIITAIFPPLGMLIWLVVIIFLLIRIKFIKDNWAAIKLGVKFYTVLTLLVTALSFSSGLYSIIFWPIVLVASIAIGYVIAKLMTKKFDVWLSELYEKGYSPKHALGIMGSAPLLLITLLLPFLKMAIPADFVMVEGTEVKAGTMSEPVMPKGSTIHTTSVVEASPIIEPTVTEAIISETKPSALVKIHETTTSTGETKLKVKANTKGIVKTSINVTEAIVKSNIVEQQSIPSQHAEQFANLAEHEQSKVLEVKKDTIGSQHTVDEWIQSIDKDHNEQ